MDQNSNKIFDNLESVMARSTEAEKIPVLIMARAEQDLAEVEKAVGSLEVKHRYRVVPAMAATVTTEQVRDLAKLEQVQHIEHDAEVRIAMDGANRWFGAAQARSDYGVTGDRDGSAGFSKSDVVVAVIDTGTWVRYRT